eukprot:2835434-Amphidinium_carterae.1
MIYTIATGVTLGIVAIIFIRTHINAVRAGCRCCVLALNSCSVSLLALTSCSGPPPVAYKHWFSVLLQYQTNKNALASRRQIESI